MAEYEVQAPDGNKVRFTAPDDASEDELYSYVRDNYKPEPAPLDENRFQWGKAFLGDNALGELAQSRVDDPDKLKRDVGRAGRAIVGGIASFPDLPRVATNPLFAVGAEAAGAMGADDAKSWMQNQVKQPYFADQARELYDKATDNQFVDKTGYDQIGSFVGEMILSGLGPAAVSKIAALAEKLGMKATELIGRTMQAITGGGEGRAERELVKILKDEGLSNDDIMRIAESVGKDKIPVTLPEKAGSPAAMDLQRMVTDTGGIEGPLAKQAIARQSIIPDVVERTYKDTATDTAVTSSGERIQQLSADIIKEAIDARTAASRPFYEADSGVPLIARTAKKNTGRVDPATGRQITDDVSIPFVDDLAENNPAIKSALKEIERDPAFQQIIKDDGYSRESAGYLEEVRKRLSARVNDALTPGLGKAPDKQKAKGLTGAIKKIDKVLEKNAPNIIRGRAEHAERSPEVQKLIKGVFGALRDAKRPDKAMKIILSRPKEQIAVVRDAIIARDPQAWENLVSSHLLETVGKFDDPSKLIKALSKESVDKQMRLIMSRDQYKSHRLLIKNLDAVMAEVKRVAPSLDINSPNALREIGARSAAFAEFQEGIKRMLILPLAYRTGLMQAGRAAPKVIWPIDNDAFARAMISPDLEGLAKALKPYKTGSPGAMRVINQYLTPKLGPVGRIASENADPDGEQ